MDTPQELDFPRVLAEIGKQGPKKNLLKRALQLAFGEPVKTAQVETLAEAVAEVVDARTARELANAKNLIALYQQHYDAELDRLATRFAGSVDDYPTAYTLATTCDRAWFASLLGSKEAKARTAALFMRTVAPYLGQGYSHPLWERMARLDAAVFIELMHPALVQLETEQEL
jgi:hypothetical protein